MTSLEGTIANGGLSSLLGSLNKTIDFFYMNREYKIYDRSIIHIGEPIQIYDLGYSLDLVFQKRNNNQIPILVTPN
jgi:hypothetical protein